MRVKAGGRSTRTRRHQYLPPDADEYRRDFADLGIATLMDRVVTRTKLVSAALSADRRQLRGGV
jgi:hypothetical protein